MARKGGEALFHKKGGEHAHAIRHWVEQNGFVGMLIAALLPPPTPFKFFVFAAEGVLNSLFCFTSAVTLSRLSGYFFFPSSPLPLPARTQHLPTLTTLPLSTLS